jgi:hypothetical protein
MNNIVNYETDFYAWTQEQASFLQSGKFDCLDLENLAEEIASLGRQERRELVNRLGILIGHILKWEYQPDMRSKSWQATIIEQQRKIARHLKENPSLQSFLELAILEGYEDGILLVIKETLLNTNDLPENCPYSFAEIINYQAIVSVAQ